MGRVNMDRHKMRCAHAARVNSVLRVYALSLLLGRFTIVAR